MPSPADPDSHAERGRCRSGVSMSADIIRVCDDSSREDIAEAITHLGEYAAHQLHHPDCKPWVTAHRRIDALLDDWQATDPNK